MSWKKGGDTSEKSGGKRGVKRDSSLRQKTKGEERRFNPPPKSATTMKNRRLRATWLQATDEEFAFVDHFFREMVVEFDEELFVVDDFTAPGFAVEFLESVEFLARKIQAGPFHIVVIGHPADGSFAALGAYAGTVHNPFEDTHIFAVAGPDEFSFGVFTEPVHVEDARSDGKRALHLDPVTKIIAHVIAAERKHGHGIATNFARAADGGSRHF